jgi:hypothetical protein
MIGEAFSRIDIGFGADWRAVIILILLVSVTLAGCAMFGRTRLIYDGNGNTGGIVPIDVYYYLHGDTVTVALEGSLTKNGYSFVGCTTASDGSGASYAASATFTMGWSQVILFAQWAANAAVIYDGNGNTGGTVPNDSNDYASRVIVTVAPSGTLERTNYTFVGWNTAADGSGLNYGTSGTFTMGLSNVTLFAQ